MMTAQPPKANITTRFQKEHNFLARRFLIELLHHEIFWMKVDGDPNLERWVMTDFIVRLSYIYFFSVRYVVCAPSIYWENFLRLASLKVQHAETFGKELVMTSDEASMKNSMLPKGYAYVPADCLSNDKHSNEDIYASEPVEHDR